MSKLANLREFIDKHGRLPRIDKDRRRVTHERRLYYWLQNSLKRYKIRNRDDAKQTLMRDPVVAEVWRKFVLRHRILFRPSIVRLHIHDDQHTVRRRLDASQSNSDLGSTWPKDEGTPIVVLARAHGLESDAT
jgi:hypothetical protein